MVRATRAASTFADEVDELVEELAEWTADSIEEVIDAIIGDGRPIFTENKSEREQVTEYFKIRHNPEAWRQWMAERDAELRDRIGIVFEAMEVPPEFITQLHPFDIVVREAIAYSKRMERLAREYERKTDERIKREQPELRTLT